MTSKERVLIIISSEDQDVRVVIIVSKVVVLVAQLLDKERKANYKRDRDTQVNGTLHGGVLCCRKRIQETQAV